MPHPALFRMRILLRVFLAFAAQSSSTELALSLEGPVQPEPRHRFTAQPPLLARSSISG
jgi:hypothetical protein